jgi:D-amino peptidase
MTSRSPQRWTRPALAFSIVAATVALLAQPAAAQAPPGKKVYISVDMEGISGIADPSQLSLGQPEYGRYRKLMAADVNAAIAGAVRGGAGEIVVNDSHGSMRNLALEDLDPPARLISHSFKAYGMMEGLDETFDAVYFVGYHAQAGSPVGFAAHTGSGVVRDLRVNGRSVGEAGLNALLAAWYGVPVVFGSGDQVAAAQIRNAAPQAHVVVTKQAINSRAVELRPLQLAHDEIAREAAEAVKAARRGAPRREGSYRVELQFNGTAQAEIAEALPQIERLAPDTLAFTTTSMPHAYRVIRILYRYINPD